VDVVPGATDVAGTVVGDTLVVGASVVGANVVGASDVDAAVVGAMLVGAIVGVSVEAVVEGCTDPVVVVADSFDPQAARPSRSAAAPT
jgi:hypothetical protein